LFEIILKRPIKGGYIESAENAQPISKIPVCREPCFNSPPFKIPAAVENAVISSCSFDWIIGRPEMMIEPSYCGSPLYWTKNKFIARNPLVLNT
jgi:hypothetical protein